MVRVPSFGDPTEDPAKRLCPASVVLERMHLLLVGEKPLVLQNLFPINIIK